MLFRAALVAAAVATAPIGWALPANAKPPCYVGSSGDCVPDPTTAPPPGSTPHALCRDGDYSFSEHRSGTCSGHGGVQQWFY
jgi:Protein of unknown function (DUF3761)